MKGAFSSYPQVETAPFISKIEAVMSDLPKQEARAAKFMLLNSRDLGFQAGASIANRAGVSEVTVSRLLHRLGYRGMSDLKREMQEEQQAGQMGLYPHKSAIEDYGPLKSVLDAEIKALITVFEQFHTPIWQRLVAEVSEAECVFVTGFQTALMAKDLRLYVESAPTVLGLNGVSHQGQAVLVIGVAIWCRGRMAACQARLGVLGRRFFAHIVQ